MTNNPGVESPNPGLNPRSPDFEIRVARSESVDCETRTMRRGTRLELGDWQTPEGLCRDVLAVLDSSGAPPPAAVVEPTCGRGAFLVEASRRFPAATLWGVDLNPGYVAAATAATAALAGARARV